MTTSTFYRGSMRGGLLQIKQLGLQPGTIIDVGAALGTFELYDIFPECRHFLIEPIAENEPYLAKLCQKLGNAEYIIAAATEAPGTVTLQVNPELVHSSTVDAADASLPAHAQYRTITAVSLDHLCQDKQLPPPYLIKVDVDGKEVEVLKGAIATLRQTEYIIVESTLFGQLYDVMDFMRSQGFVVYDIVDLAWRPGDRALWQVDMAFVKENGAFRQQKAYTQQSGDPGFAEHLQAYRDQCIALIENYPDRAQATPAPLPLQSTTLIAFPDWHQPEEVLFQSLVTLLRFVLTHPDHQQMTLLLYGAVDEEQTANEAIASAVFYLLTEEAIDADAGPEIVLVSPQSLTPSVLAQLSGRIEMASENQEAIATTGAKDLPIIPIE